VRIDILDFGNNIIGEDHVCWISMRISDLGGGACACCGQR